MKDLRLTDGFYRRYPVVRKSMAHVRCDEGEYFGGANLIVHHGLMNIIHQLTKPLHILGVVKELRDILLSCHLV